MKQQLLTLMISLVFVSQANALFELRAGYGIQTPASEEAGTDTLTTLSGMNFDAIVEIPMVPFGLGLRYEDFGSEVTTLSNGLVDANYSRTSLLINYRLIDFFTYLGIIGTIGLSNEYSIEVPGNVRNYEADMTYSIGVEAGLSFGLFMVGAELGYIMANFESAGNPDVDLGGIYGKALVGVGF